MISKHCQRFFKNKKAIGVYKLLNTGN